MANSSTVPEPADTAARGARRRSSRLFFLLFCFSWTLFGYVLYVAIFRYEPITLHPAQDIIQMYGHVKETRDSDYSHVFNIIIRLRQTCFAKSDMASLELRQCMDDYTKSVIHLSRKFVNSVPRLPKFIQCLSKCPIMHSICEGDRTLGYTKNCMVIERNCIEYCLDLYWRGHYQRFSDELW